MGRKSSADGGPVHSPIVRHYANEAKNSTKQAKQKEQKKQKPKTNKTATKTPNKKLAQ
jgi:hypothetical protein